jgi:acyl-CoA synthetase (AMP-forming)/AMP-acid ligase II
MMAGGIVVNLNVLYTKDELRFLFDDTTPTVLFTYDAILPLVKVLNRESATPIGTVIVTKLTDFMAGTPVSNAADLGLEAGYLHLSEVLDTDRRWAPRWLTSNMMTLRLFSIPEEPPELPKELS